MSEPQDILSRPVDPKPLVCISYWQNNYKSLADLTIKDNRVEYAQAHGYGMRFTEYFFPDQGEPWQVVMRRMSFAKFEVILRAMEQENTPWIWYADCDGMVMKMSFDLLAFADSLGDGHVFNTCDSNGPNGGSMLIANTPRARAFFLAAQKLEQDPSVPYDNEAMAKVSDQFPGVYKVIPQRPINTYLYDLYPGQGKAPNDAQGNPGWYEPGMFFVHWPGRTLEQRIQHYHEMKGQVLS